MKRIIRRRITIRKIAEPAAMPFGRNITGSHPDHNCPRCHSIISVDSKLIGPCDENTEIQNFILTNDQNS
ncbi:MAG: hypothetical protein ABI878_05905 [Acidobacteriota bacterium]